MSRFRSHLNGLASEPYMPFLRPDVFVPYTPPNSPMFPGPGWHKGPGVAARLPLNYNSRNAEEDMSYGRIGDVPYNPVVGPVMAPNAAFFRPGGVGRWEQGPAPYIPRNLPGPIYPGPGWHVGPAVVADRIDRFVVSERDSVFDFAGDDTKPAEETSEKGWKDYAMMAGAVAGIAYLTHVGLSMYAARKG